MLQLSWDTLLTIGANIALIAFIWGRLDSRLKSVEKAQENHDEFRDLVTRLDERMKSLGETLKSQPQTIALCVGEAIKAAFKVSGQPTPAVRA